MGARNRVGIGFSYRPARARICKRLGSPGIDSEAAYVAWRAGTTNRVAVPSRQAGNRFLASLKVLKYGLWLHRLAEFIPWNRFLGSLNV